MTVAPGAALCAEAVGRGRTRVTPAPDHKALAVTSAVVRVASLAEGARLTALARARESS